MEDNSAEALVPRFKLSRLLNQDQGSRRVTLLGTIDEKPSLLTIERAALPTEPATLETFHTSLSQVTNLGANDIYHWYLANVKPTAGIADLKLNLIYPCTEAQIKKYSPQSVRVVTETPAIYAQHVRPHMVRKREEGRLNWVYNIIEGRTEQEDIILRSSRELGKDEEGFLLLPDMNWDKKTMSTLRILGLVERRDLMSLRDLRKKHVPWLEKIYKEVVAAVADIYDGVEEDMLKVYVHYQPTYYHFHLHIVSVALEPNATQAVGKAFSLPNLISQLASMAGGPEASLADIPLTYTIGNGSELWEQVFAPLKAGDSPVIDIIGE